MAQVPLKADTAYCIHVNPVVEYYPPTPSHSSMKLTHASKLAKIAALTMNARLRVGPSPFANTDHPSSRTLCAAHCQELA